MQIHFTGHQLDVTDGLREFTTDKFNRLIRHFDKITRIDVIFDKEKIRHRVQAKVHIPGKDLVASEESSEDMYSAINLLVDKLDRQLKRYRGKQVNHSE